MSAHQTSVVLKIKSNLVLKTALKTSVVLKTTLKMSAVLKTSLKTSVFLKTSLKTSVVLVVVELLLVDLKSTAVLRVKPQLS